MMEQFTPGPWSWHQCFDPTGKRVTSLDICPHDGHSLTGVAVVASVWGGQEANAHLIAAAPEMYAALDAALPILEGIADELSTDLGAAVQEGGRISAEEHAAMSEAAERLMKAARALAKARGAA